MSRFKWIVIDTGKNSAATNMEIDARLLKELDSPSSFPTLHLYDWEVPSATYGHFIDPTTYFSDEAFHDAYFQLARRPTGGGVTFHTTDWAFSILIPSSHFAYSTNVLDNYRFINQLVIRALNRFMGSVLNLSLLLEETKFPVKEVTDFCMGTPTKYDVMLEGRKIGGAAQRRTKSGFLHQGTISLTYPEKTFLNRILKKNNSVEESILKNTYPLLSLMSSLKVIEEARKDLSEAFKQEITR